MYGLKSKNKLPFATSAISVKNSSIDMLEASNLYNGYIIGNSE